MKLYGYRNGRTLRALWTLEETGSAYEYVQVDILRGEGFDVTIPRTIPANDGGISFGQAAFVRRGS